jgi:hypothetical protein
MKEAPQNKMVTTSDESTKAAKPEKQKTSYFYPKYQVSVEAESQAEADEKLPAVLKERGINI